VLLLSNASAAPPSRQGSCSPASSSPCCSLPLPSCAPMELATVWPNASVRMCAAFSLPPLTQVETTLLVTPRAKLDAKLAAPAFWAEMLLVTLLVTSPVSASTEKSVTSSLNAAFTPWAATAPAYAASPDAATALQLKLLCKPTSMRAPWLTAVLTAARTAMSAGAAAEAAGVIPTSHNPPGTPPGRAPPPTHVHLEPASLPTAH